MSTIAKISQKTGLALSTVAGVLRNAPGFSEVTRKRVLRVAEEVGYRPNFLSKALAGGKSMTIGVLGWALTSPSIAMKLESIEATARESGYLCFLANAEFENVESQLSHLRGLLDRRIDGLILDYIVVPPPKQVLNLLRKSNVPYVFMDWAPQAVMNKVTINRAAGYEAVAKHLASLGHKRAAYISTAWDLAHPQEKVRPYRECLSAEGIELVFGDQWSFGNEFYDFTEAVYRIVRRQLKEPASKRPTALILGNDQAALAAMRAAGDAGLAVPAEISVVGFDDLPFAAMARPSITTVHQPRREVGEAAFATLLALMNDPQSSPPQIDFACRLVVRESTGPAPGN